MTRQEAAELILLKIWPVSGLSPMTIMRATVKAVAFRGDATSKAGSGKSAGEPDKSANVEADGVSDHLRRRHQRLRRRTWQP